MGFKRARPDLLFFKVCIIISSNWYCNREFDMCNVCIDMCNTSTRTDKSSRLKPKRSRSTFNWLSYCSAHYRIDLERHSTDHHTFDIEQQIGVSQRFYLKMKAFSSCACVRRAGCLLSILCQSIHKRTKVAHCEMIEIGLWGTSLQP